jgi:hypothetical protein
MMSFNSTLRPEPGLSTTFGKRDEIEYPLDCAKFGVRDRSGSTTA